MSDAPPSYDKAQKLREFEKELAKAFLNKDVQGQFVLDIGMSPLFLSTPAPTRMLIFLFADRFTATTKDLTDKFNSVGVKLKEFDDLGLGDEKGTPLNTTWGGFRDVRSYPLLSSSLQLLIASLG